MSASEEDRLTCGDAISVSAALKEAERRLDRGGIDQPRLAAQLLLAHLLGVERVHLITRGEAPLAADAKYGYLCLVRRCADGEPLPYLTGKREFFGLTFRVTPAVLIPRPETEMLVEKVIHLAENVRAHPPVWVDVGTGSGCIAVSVASALPGSGGWAVDSSQPALAVAAENARDHGVSDRIRFVCSDILEGFRPEPSFDFVLSNPPYVAIRDRASLDRGVRDFEPHEALFSGDSGLEFIERLLPQAHSRLRAGGTLLMEIGMGQSDEVVARAEREGFIIDDVLDDLQGIPRCIAAQKRPGGGKWTR